MKETNSLKSKILLVEDDGAMRRFLEISLQRAGYKIVSAEDGLSALQIALTETFDVVITDAVMPNLTGHDLCRILRQNEDFKNVPLIILSGLGKEITEKSEQNCADVYLVKGANLKDKLIEKLATMIGSENQ